MTIGDKMFNNTKVLYLTALDRLESIRIGHHCFESVKTFNIDGLNQLKTIIIGNDSFTSIKKTEGDHLYYSTILANADPSKSFHILNCESLESIEIGEYSFCDFGGDFELKNLPQLQSIHIGTWRRKSFNFCASSFVIRGIKLIMIV